MLDGQPRSKNGAEDDNRGICHEDFVEDRYAKELPKNRSTPEPKVKARFREMDDQMSFDASESFHRTLSNPSDYSRRAPAMLH